MMTKTPLKTVNTRRRFYSKATVIPITVVLAVMILIYPQNCLDGARAGLDLWLRAVLPSLFPFMVASFMLLETGIVRFAAHVFAPLTRKLFGAPGESAYIFLASALSGYPVGARLAGEMYAGGQLSEDDAGRIVRFTSVTGPVFLTGAVGTGMLGAPEAGAHLAAAHYLSALLVGIVFFSFERRRGIRTELRKTSWREVGRNLRHDVAACPPIGEMLSRSIEKSLLTLLRIGGFIILFSVILEMLDVTRVMDFLSFLYAPMTGLTGLDRAATQALIAGGLEISIGCARTALLDLPITTKLILASGIVAFGGLCVHMQTTSVLASCGLKARRFVLAKSLHGLFCGILTALFLSLFPLATAASNLGEQTKTAAYGGVIFAAAALAVLIALKLWQRRLRQRSVFPLSR